MITRRRFLERTLQTSSLVALGRLVPEFLAQTARAAEPGKDSVLVVVEMTGGNDGLNTVVPYADDHYHKARPTLALRKDQVIRVDDHIGLHPSLRSLEPMLQKGNLAVVQGVGYPNPDRSHFESMDIWQSADPKRKTGNGWLGRGLGDVEVLEGHIGAVHVGKDKLPLALQGSAMGVPSIHPDQPFDLNLGGGPGAGRGRQAFQVVAKPTPVATAEKPPPVDKDKEARRRLIHDLAELSPAGKDDMLQFVRRSSLQTYATIDRLREITQQGAQDMRYYSGPGKRYGELAHNLSLVARMIQAGFGTRIFYVSIDGFDTHANQANDHPNLLQQISDAVSGFFQQLEQAGQSKRVLLMTFSEFGRRIQENGSKGTDHGAASCLFLVGPAAKGGAVGKHPSLAKDDLDGGDLKFHTDFRQVYATLLDRWLGCDSSRVLAGKFEHLALVK